MSSDGDGAAEAASGAAEDPSASADQSPGEDGGRDGGAASGPRNWRPQQAPPVDDGFDWRGWLLVAAIVVAFFVVPGAILALPYAQGVVASLGLTLRDAYLTLPMIPAVLLAALAVWAAVRTRQQ